MASPFDDLDPEERPSGRPDDRAGDRHDEARAFGAPVDRRPRRAREQALRPPARRHVVATRAFVRGLTRRCPRCGGGRLFVSWFRIRERCPRCALPLQREEGGFLGAMTINYAVTAAVWVGVLVVWLALDLPDVHVLRLTLASLGVAVVVPLAFWPFSKTIWAVVDYLVYRTDPGYRSLDAADRASGNGGAHDA